MSVADSMADSGRKPAVYSQLICFLLYMIQAIWPSFHQRKLEMHSIKRMKGSEELQVDLRPYGIYRKHDGLTYWSFLYL